MADFELVGKKKKIIDATSWGSPPRLSNHGGPQGGTGASPIGMSSDFVEMFQHGLRRHPFHEIIDGRMVFLEKGGEPLRDTLRICLGKNWDFIKKDASSDKKELGNNWAPLAVWYNNGLELEYCDPNPTELYIDPAAFTLHGADVDAWIAENPHLIDESGKLTVEGKKPAFSLTSEHQAVPPLAYTNGMVTEQKIVIKCDLSNEVIDEFENNPDFAPTQEKWMFLMKAGLKGVDGEKLHPIVTSPRKVFSDLYHETSLPFTKKELASKQPAGKAFFADVRTYYNERVGSSSRSGGRNMSFENRIKAPSMHNSIPTIYGFLDILYNELDVGELYQKFADYGSNLTPALVDQPFGMLTTFWGKISKETIKKFTNINYDRDDVTAFYEDYFDEWAETSSNPSLLGAFFEALALNILERAFTNIAFSPNVASFVNKIEKYKNYFPFYSEIEFSAKILTEIGDLIKKTYMTKYLSTVIAENSTYKSDAWTLERGDLFPESAANGWMRNRPFIQYYEEKVYEDTNADSQLSVEEMASPIAGKGFAYPIATNQTDVLRIFRVLKEFVDDNPDYIYPEEDGLDVDDIQNYVSYLHNELSTAQGDISTCNAFFKTIFGNVLLNKIIETYKTHRRNYSEILQGVPAYTEDIFYRIEKLVKKKGETSFQHLQNIIIPNTSDLDIVKYVDTQVKYADEAVYKYRVYAERIIFGSLYNYLWIDPETNEVQTPDWNYFPGDEENLDVIPTPTDGSNLTGTSVSGASPKDKKAGIFTATLKVRVMPNIAMMEDLIFSTPEVRILDRPPIAPDVNILPYRAVNNKIKILFNGMVDRYRDFPIYINKEVDEARFNFIKEAQFSSDGKVEFGSDDPIKKFEIFRTKVKPKKYTDFEFYKTVNSKFYEEKILPNTKYYYTFRSVDNHDHISNPSAIFEVELVDEHGAVRPMIRVIELDKPAIKEHVKECQKYIYIKPTPQQVYTSGKQGVDYMFTNNQGNAKRRFKVRLTSKSTGKKLDVNVAFKKK